ncbi:MAG: biotin--[acetyl-CoA-carboxylase] ligase [Nitrospirae bacterium]|nr:biotin--[acetyl-CoA-carboxylase] ligase [Nitrospirota bacterium]
MQVEKIDNLILNTFKERQDEFVSGQAISNQIKITRAAVWKHIEGLRKKGYVIISVPSKGYKLIETPDILSAADIKKEIKTTVIGNDILVFDEVKSTNDITMELASKGGKEGLVVIAESQLHGKGRLGRQWISPKGVNIYASFLIRPEIPPVNAPVLTMMASLAAAEAIAGTTGLEAWIKWPNDILVNQKKISGILTEMNAEEEKINYVVIGIGINVNMKNEDFPDSFRIPATSVMDSLGRKSDRTKLLCFLIESMDSNYEYLRKKGIMSIMSKWRKLCITLNKMIKVTSAGGAITGVAEDITTEGGLVIRIGEDSTKVIYSGDVTVME